MTPATWPHRYMFLFLGLLSGAGCVSGIKAGEVTSKDRDHPPDGLRYYMPARYLVIQQQADGKWDAAIQSVVDTSHEYYVQPYAIFASGAATAEFNDDGTLKSFKLVSKASDVPLAAVDALKGIELEREKLLQDALDALKKQAGSKPPEAPPAGPPARQPPERREVYMFRIEGDHLVGSGMGPIAKPVVVPAREQP